MTGCFITASAGLVLALVGPGWEWLAIPYGTLILFGLLAATSALTFFFLKKRRSSLALPALLLFTLAALFYLPGAYGQILPLGSHARIVYLFALVVSCAPLVFAPLSWREFHRWKQVPGSSEGIEGEGSEETFDEVVEALKEIGEFTAKNVIRK
jgi:hypothetical protein